MALIILCQKSKWNFCTTKAPSLISWKYSLVWMCHMSHVSCCDCGETLTPGPWVIFLRVFVMSVVSPDSGSDWVQTLASHLISAPAHWVMCNNQLPLALSQPLVKTKLSWIPHKMGSNILPWLARSPTSYPLESWMSPTIGISRDSEEEVTDHLNGSGSDIRLPRLVTRTGAGAVSRQIQSLFCSLYWVSDCFQPSSQNNRFLDSYLRNKDKFSLRPWGIIRIARYCKVSLTYLVKYFLHHTCMYVFECLKTLKNALTFDILFPSVALHV